MFRIPPAPAAREPTAVNHHPLGGAAAVGALLGVGVLALTLADVPVLAWMLLGAVATTALVDIAYTAAGWESPSLLEPLAQRRLGSAWPGAVRRPGRLSIGVLGEVEGGLDGG